MEIISLNSKHIKKASHVLAKAFFDYPMMKFYFPDIRRRTRYLPWYFRNVLRCALRYGKIYASSDLKGVCFTLPPGHTKISNWEYVQNGFLLTPVFMGFENYRRSMDCENFVANIHKKLMGTRRHYYLWGLAVDPDHKAKGLGTALMQHVLLQTDAEKLPIYLETHDERNVSYYQKFGFALKQTAKIPKYDLHIWCMVRE